MCLLDDTVRIETQSSKSSYSSVFFRGKAPEIVGRSVEGYLA
jgi:hypothetical protein